MTGSTCEPPSGYGYAPVAAFFAIGLIGYLLPATAFFAAVPGDIGDSRFNSVVLEHLYHFATGAAGSLWDPGFFFPLPGVLAFSDNLLGSGAIYVVARLAGLQRALAVDVWFIVGGALNFAAAYYAINRLGASSLGAAAGAFIFAFGIAAGVGEAHMQLVYRFGVPLAAVSFLEALRSPRLSALAATALWVAWQFYCSIYLGVFLVYLLAALAVAHLAVGRSLRLDKWVRQMRSGSLSGSRLVPLVIVLACLAAVAYLLGTYAWAGRFYGFSRSLGEIAAMLPRPQSYLLADGVPLFGEIGRQLEVPNRHEHQMFVGAGALLLVALGVAATLRNAPTRPVGARFGIALLILIVGTLSVGGLSLYLLVGWLPGVNSVRAVSRIVLAMLMPVAVLAAFGADQLLAWAGRRRVLRGAAVALVLVLAASESLIFVHYRTPIGDWYARLAALGDQMPSQIPADAVLFLRSDGRNAFADIFRQLDAVILAQDLGIVTMNGYSGNAPPGFPPTGTCGRWQDLLNGYAALTGRAPPDLTGRLVLIDQGGCTSE